MTEVRADPDVVTIAQQLARRLDANHGSQTLELVFEAGRLEKAFLHRRFSRSELMALGERARAAARLGG